MFPSVNEQMDIIKRGTEEIIPEDELVRKIESSINFNKPLIIKEGFDPTAPDLHIGHMVTIRKLKQFQGLGHTVVFLIGDFTGLVGDPSGRLETRKMMSREEIEKNAQTYREQIFKVLDPHKTVIRFNSEWLGKLTVYDFMELSSKYTVARMLERDDFKKRHDDKKDISIIEFLYCLLQGYDSVALKADVELGGTDQKFNLLTARNIQKRYGVEPQVIITMPLLVGTDGLEKMSKSLGNYIGINESPSEIYGKVLSINDELIIPYFIHATEVSDGEIKKFKKDLKDDSVNPRDLKRRLAREIVSLYHGKSEAVKAEEEFDKIFVKKQTPTEMDEFRIDRNEKIWIVKLLTLTNMCKSSSEAKRLIKQGGVTINGSRVNDPEIDIEFNKEAILKVGKRKFLKVVPK
ncbi:MAG: tyrosine--tRNA ligase [Candidatus Helarchaeota archaeon]|nr:tyrosine--tRNA ligase [Candidatus Helarchaeota archaeon]